MTDIQNNKKTDVIKEKLLPSPLKKEQLKFYNENSNIERPTETLANLKEKWVLSKQNTDVLVSLILQKLVGADPDIKSWSSDVRLQIGEYPTYFTKAEGWWIRDERMPIIEDYMMKNIYDYVIPEANKSNIVEKWAKWIKSVDEDFSIDFNVNVNFDYNYEEPDTTHKYNNQYSTKPQYLVDVWWTAEFRLSRFRWNLTKSRGDYVIILRKIDSDIPDFYDLKLNPRFLEFLDYDRWLVLVTWPTWSWKSTTLAALINEINKSQKKHIITLENPIEFVHTNKMSFFTQRDIPWDSASFQDWIRSALRQKPDIILFWEMRDQETIAGAIEAAETWHLVFWTLHTFNAAKTIDRLLNSFPENARSQVAASLSWAFVGAISQTLVKTKAWGVAALNEMVKWTDWVKKAISEMDSAKITASAWNDPDNHLTMVNHALQLIKDNLVEQNELFKKIFIEDVDTYNALVQKLKAESIYDWAKDLFTIENIKKQRKEKLEEIEKRMWVEKMIATTSNLSETSKIENDLNNMVIDKKSRLL